MKNRSPIIINRYITDFNIQINKVNTKINILITCKNSFKCKINTKYRFSTISSKRNIKENSNYRDIEIEKMLNNE